METRIKERFNEYILLEAMRRYGIAEGHIHLLDGFESFMYEFDWMRGGVPESGILRIGHSLRRTPALIQAEVDWINYLTDGGAGVAKAWLSVNNNLVEAVDDGQGGQFLVTAFAKALGRHPDRTEWTPAFFEIYGQLIGRMHALSRRYTPPHADCVRPHWNDEVNMEVEKFLPQGDEHIAEQFRALLTHLETLPVNPEGYGLIHQDAHGGNFFVDEAGQITLFDFDDCCYGHYIYDIAMVVFYAIVNRSDMPAATREFMRPFLRGYSRENQLDPVWLKEIPHFLKLREIDLYAIIHRSMGSGPYEDDWVRRYMEGRKARLDAGLPFVEFDFRSLDMHPLNLAALLDLQQPPAPFTPGEPLFWDDPHISAQMLAFHLDPGIDAASRRPETIDRSVAWIAATLGLQPGDAVLDLGCGPGLYATRLAGRGLRVTGVDYSRRSIAYAGDYARKHGLDITYRYQNYLELADENQYDAALLIYGDFCPLSPGQRTLLLQNVHRALKPGGRFVLDVSTRECRKRYQWKGSSPYDFSSLGGAKTATFGEFRLAVKNCPDWRFLESGFWKPGPHLLLEQGFDFPAQSIWLDQAVVIEENGKISVYRMWFQDYTPESITAELQAGGFAFESLWSDLTGKLYTDGSEWIGLVTRKM